MEATLAAAHRSAVLGAILLTGYLGGALSISLRAASPAFETRFPAIVGILVRGGLLLRDGRLRDLLPPARGRCAPVDIRAAGSTR